MLSSSEALVFPPAGGPEIVTVIGRTYSNAAEQKVILRSAATTPGQNYFKAEFFGPQKSEDTGGDALPFGGFRTATVAREIRSEFPGLNIAMSAAYLQNSYGAFSYATGRGRGTDTCLYGWQDIRSPESMRQDFRNLGRIKIRLRLCEPDASVERLLNVMYNYTITGSYASSSWNPYGTPQRVDPNLGRPGHPVYPLRSTDVPMRPGQEVTASVPAVRRAVTRTVPAQAEVQQPLPPVAPVSIPSPLPAGASGQQISPVPASQTQNAVQTPSQVQQVVIPSPACLTGSGSRGCGQP